jgi:hypothetical protein
MWDEEVENLLFRIYTMSPDQKKKFMQFINSNPFFTQDYPMQNPIKRGPFSMRSFLYGVIPDSNNDPFERSIGGLGAAFDNISFDNKRPAINVFKTLYD